MHAVGEIGLFCSVSWEPVPTPTTPTPPPTPRHPMFQSSAADDDDDDGAFVGSTAIRPGLPLASPIRPHRFRSRLIPRVCADMVGLYQACAPVTCLRSSILLRPEPEHQTPRQCFPSLYRSQSSFAVRVTENVGFVTPLSSLSDSHRHPSRPPFLREHVLTNSTVLPTRRFYRDGSVFAPAILCPRTVRSYMSLSRLHCPAVLHLSNQFGE